MSFENNDFETTDDEQLPEESGNNRTFLIAVGILGGIILLSIACIVGIFLFSRNNQAAQDAAVQAATQTAAASNGFINQALTATAAAQVILPSATLPPTNTPVVNVATATSTPDPNATSSPIAGFGTPSAATATVGAALTQAAIAQLTIVPTTTALPNTGFVDDYGVPGLAVMALAFIIVIMFARRLRATPTR